MSNDPKIVILEIPAQLRPSVSVERSPHEYIQDLLSKNEEALEEVGPPPDIATDPDGLARWLHNVLNDHRYSSSGFRVWCGPDAESEATDWMVEYGGPKGPHLHKWVEVQSLASQLDSDLVDTHWDCECKHNFIKPASQYVCFACGAERDNQPSSMAREVRWMQKGIGPFKKEQ